MGEQLYFNLFIFFYFQIADILVMGVCQLEILNLPHSKKGHVAF